MRRTRKKTNWLRRWVSILAVVLALCLVALVLLVMTRDAATPEAPKPSVPATTHATEATETMQLAATTEATQTTETVEATVPTEAATEPSEPTEAATKPTQPAQEAKPTEPAPTIPQTEPTAPPKPENPADLTAILAASGYTYQDLAQKNSRQLVTVVSGGDKAQIRFFVLEEDTWQEKAELKTSGYVGRNGVSASKKEGDGCTPGGLYSVGTGFYISKAPDTALELFQITADTYWVDDPDSAYYNQRVEGTENKDWNSAEKMSSYKTAYRYGFVVDYNTDCTPGAGSAIFFHVGSKSTAGCIATAEKMVLKYLSSLDAGKNPYILIISEKDLTA